MKDSRTRFCISQIAYICLAIITFYEVMSISALGVSYESLSHALSRIHKICSWVLILLALYSVFIEKFNKLKSTLFVIFIFFIAFSAKTWIIFDLLFFPLFYSYNLDINRCYKIIFVVLIFSLFLIVTIDHFDFFEKYRFLRDGSERYALGFYHPNSLGLTIMFIGMLYVLIKEKTNMIDIVFLFCLCLIIKYLTDSRTSFYTLLIFSIFCCINNFVENHIKKLLGKNLFIISVVCTILIIGFMYYVAISGWNLSYFDRIINGRIEFGGIALDRLGLSWLGQKYSTAIEWQTAKGEEYFVIDSLFFYFPIAVGIIPSIFLCFWYFYSVWKNLEKKNAIIFVMLILFILYGVTESVAFTSGLCMFIFMSAFNNSSSSYVHKN